MIELKNESWAIIKYTIKQYPLYEWYLFPDETDKYQQLWIKNISYPEMKMIDEYPNDLNYIPKIKEEIMKNHLDHIRQMDELDEIAETIEDMYYRIKRIREKEVSQ